MWNSLKRILNTYWIEFALIFIGMYMGGWYGLLGVVLIILVGYLIEIELTR